MRRRDTAAPATEFRDDFGYAARHAVFVIGRKVKISRDVRSWDLNGCVQDWEQTPNARQFNWHRLAAK